MGVENNGGLQAPKYLVLDKDVPDAAAADVLDVRVDAAAAGAPPIQAFRAQSDSAGPRVVGPSPGCARPIRRVGGADLIQHAQQHLALGLLGLRPTNCLRIVHQLGLHLPDRSSICTVRSGSTGYIIVALPALVRIDVHKEILVDRVDQVAPLKLLQFARQSGVKGRHADLGHRQTLQVLAQKGLGDTRLTQGVRQRLLKSRPADTESPR